MIPPGADITVRHDKPARTFAVPKTVAATVAGAMSTDTPRGDGYERELIERLMTLGRITVEDARHIQTRSMSASGALYGGEVGAEWARKIVEGAQRDQRAACETLLASLGYDAHTYRYLGLTREHPTRRIEALGRLSVGSAGGARLSVLDGQEWVSACQEHVSGRVAVPLSRELVAFTASAFAEGHRAVVLKDGVPLTFLLERLPLVAAALAPAAPQDDTDTETSSDTGTDEDAETSGASSAGSAAGGGPAATLPGPAAVTPDVTKGQQPGAHYYAMVDALDTSAVSSLIKITPGPQVWARNGGQWLLDPPTLATLMSITPPPLVELSGSTLTAVAQQVDSSQAQQLLPGSGGQPVPGPGLSTQQSQQQQQEQQQEQDQQQQQQEQSQQLDSEQESGAGGVTASAMAVCAELRRVHDVAALVLRDPGDVRAVRATAIHAALTAAAALRRRRADLEAVLVPAACAPTPGNPNFLRQRHDHYWVDADGSTVKIWWK